MSPPTRFAAIDRANSGPPITMCHIVSTDPTAHVLDAVRDTVRRDLAASGELPHDGPRSGEPEEQRLTQAAALALVQAALDAALPLVTRIDDAGTLHPVVRAEEPAPAKHGNWLAPLLEALGDHESPTLDTLADTILAGAERNLLPGGLEATALCDRAVIALALVAAEYPELVHWWRTGTLARPDLEEAILAEVHRTLMIDAEWTIALEGGFGWVAHRLLQRVHTGPRIWSRGVSGMMLISGTCVVQDVTAPTEDVEVVLAALNTLAVGSGWFFDREARSLWLGCSHFVHPGSVGFRVRQHAEVTILQLEEAERMADALAAQLGGRVADRTHPMQRSRTVPDEMLGVVEQVYRPAGRAPSAFARAEEFEVLALEIPPSVAATLGGSASGIAFEVPFGDASTALVQLMADVEHPVLGAGLAVGTLFDVGKTVPELATMAQRLQQLQATTTRAGGGYGAWGVKDMGEQAFLGFFRFLPNRSYRAGVTSDVAMGELNRAAWLDAMLHPGLTRRDATAQMVRRWEGGASA